MQTKPTPIKTYAEFWPFYLHEHSRAGTKHLHVWGTLLGVALVITLVVSGHALWFPVGFLVGYAFSWVGHFFVEKNRPATFKYPFWSFISDFRMIYCYFRGRY